MVWDNLGSSSSVLWMVANTVGLFNCSAFKTLHKFKSNPLHWQVSALACVHVQLWVWVGRGAGAGTVAGVGGGVGDVASRCVCVYL
jgi:hypothetical protein